MTLKERHTRDARLIRRARRGDQEAKAELVAYYDALAWKIARRYVSAWLTPEDLVQEARLGLLDAVERWNPRRGIQFMTVAALWCRCRAARAARGLLTSGALKAFHRGGRVTHALRAELQREPTDAEVAARIGVKERDIAMCRVHSTRPTSLDRPVIDGEGYTTPLAAVIPDPTERVDERLEREGEEARVRAAVARLNPRARYILERRHLADNDAATLAEVGREMGLSRERIRQLEAEALRKLAIWLDEEAA